MVNDSLFIDQIVAFRQLSPTHTQGNSNACNIRLL